MEFTPIILPFDKHATLVCLSKRKILLEPYPNLCYNKAIKREGRFDMSRHCRKLNDMSYCSEYGLTAPICGRKITVLAICSCKESERKFFHDAPLYEVTLVFSATDIGVWQLYASKRFGQRKLSQANIDDYIAHYVDDMAESADFQTMVKNYVARECA